MNVPWGPPPADTPRRNPLVNNYRTADDHFLALNCLQAGRYWPELCNFIGRPELAAWRERLADFSGQWAVVQDSLEVAEDPQTLANGYIQECRTATGSPFHLAAAPIQFDEEAPVPGRAPDFNEHGDEILSGLGLDWDTIIDLKVKGVVA